MSLSDLLKHIRKEAPKQHTSGAESRASSDIPVREIMHLPSGWDVFAGYHGGRLQLELGGPVEDQRILRDAASALIGFAATYGVDLSRSEFHDRIDKLGDIGIETRFTVREPDDISKVKEHYFHLTIKKRELTLRAEGCYNGKPLNDLVTAIGIDRAIMWVSSEAAEGLERYADMFPGKSELLRELRKVRGTTKAGLPSELNLRWDLITAVNSLEPRYYFLDFDLSDIVALAKRYSIFQKKGPDVMQAMTFLDGIVPPYEFEVARITNDQALGKIRWILDRENLDKWDNDPYMAELIALGQLVYGTEFMKERPSGYQGLIQYLEEVGYVPKTTDQSSSGHILDCLNQHYARAPSQIVMALKEGLTIHAPERHQYAFMRTRVAPEGNIFSVDARHHGNSLDLRRESPLDSLQCRIVIDPYFPHLLESQEYVLNKFGARFDQPI